MKEYTILSIFSVIAVFFIDRLTDVNVLKKGLFWIFILIILCFKLLVNGSLTSGNIVLYDSRFFLNIRLGSIPLEDFLFGFSMVTLTISFWEFFKGSKK